MLSQHPALGTSYPPGHTAVTLLVVVALAMDHQALNPAFPAPNAPQVVNAQNSPSAPSHLPQRGTHQSHLIGDMCGDSEGMVTLRDRRPPVRP
jgi:hypothetical protein